MSNMTLEQLLRLAFDALHVSAPIPEVARHQKDAERKHHEAHKAVREYLEAHLTQPAQAVDMGAIREVIAELSCTSHQSLQGAADFCGEQADKLTRALGNAQAEGWRVPEHDADAKWALEFKAAVNVLESQEDQPHAAACGLLLIDSCMGKNAAKVTLNFDGVEHKDGSDLGDWTVTVERKRKAPTPPQPEE